LEAGEWTDDTSMALALADSIASVGWDLNDQADRYVQWWQTGKYSVNGRCFDIGNATGYALSTPFNMQKDAQLRGCYRDISRCFCSQQVRQSRRSKRLTKRSPVAKSC
jgi:ADP-ribosylglycohydrolase